MAIQLVKSDIVAKETAYKVSTSKDSKLMHMLKRPYDAEFNNYNGDTIRIVVEGSLNAHYFQDGEEIIVQDYGNTAIDLKLNTQIDVSVGISQKEATFDLDNLTLRVSADAARAISKKVENFAVESTILSLNNFIATGDLDNSNKLIDLNTWFDLRDVSIENRVAMVSTTQKSIILKNCKDIVETYKRGTNETMTGAEIGQVYGVNYFYSNVLDTLSKSALGSTYTGGATTVSSIINGTNFIQITGGVEGETIKKMSVLEVADAKFVVKEDVTIAEDGTALISLGAPLKLDTNVLYPAGYVVQYLGTLHSIAFDVNSMVLASKAPEQTVNEDMTYINDAENGFGVSVNWGYDIKTKKGIVSFSTFIGFQNVNSNLNVGLLAA